LKNRTIKKQAHRIGKRALRIGFWYNNQYTKF
jgi:hypothetical protein